jgi:DNA-binding transcriptional LysR family regulator
MKITWLRAFRAVMQTGTVTGASEILLRTQPQISRTITSLEESIGLKLFERIGRRLVPTPQALEFLAYIEPILLGVEGIPNTAANIRAKRNRPLIISTEPFLMHALIPRAIGNMPFGDVQSFAVDLCIRASGLWMSRQNIDLGVVALPFTQTDMTSIPFAVARLVAALPPGHRLTSQPVVDAAQLRDEPFIALRSSTLLRAQIDVVCAKAGVQLTPRIEVTSGVLACDLAARGLGVTLADPIVAASFADKGLVVRPMSERIELTYGFLCDEAPAGEEAVAMFMKRIADTACETGGDYVWRHEEWVKRTRRM